jgi:hypothetical protein
MKRGSVIALIKCIGRKKYEELFTAQDQTRRSDARFHSLRGVSSIYVSFTKGSHCFQ